MTDEDIVAALAEVLRAYSVGGDLLLADRQELATDLLPVVRRVAEQRAAEELLAAADWLWDDDPTTRSLCDHLQDRADDLHPVPVRFEPVDRPSSLRGRAIRARAAALTATAPTPTRPARAPIDPPKPANYHPYA